MTLDLRDALRGLRRDAGYSATVAITLALTIGATTAVFSIVNGVLLKPLAYRESHQLVEIREVMAEVADRFPLLPVNGRHFEAWRDQARTFDALAELLPASANLTGEGDAVQIARVQASAGLFDVLRTPPALGRGLRADDEAKGAPDVVVIGHALWRDRLGGDPAILGRALTLDGKPYTVVGVLPAGFQLPEAPRLGEPVQLTMKVDAVVPLRLPDGLGWAGDFNHVSLGRLKRGVTVEQARADLDVIQARTARRVSEEAGQAYTLRAHVTPLMDAVTGGARRGLLLLLAAIATVLLIACANLANLSLTRATSRLRDAAIKTALGAGRSRLVGHVLLEQAILAGAGGALGLFVAHGALGTFVRTAPIDLPRVAEVALDARVLAFTGAAAMITTLLTGLLPAWRLAGRDLQPSLRAVSLAATGDRHGLRARGALVALQVALSVTLLVVTALVGVSFVRLMGVDLGFSAERVLAVDVSLPASRYERAETRVGVYDRVLAGVQAVPGAADVSWTSALPLTGDDWADIVTADGDTRPFFSRPIANYRFVAPAFFSTLSIPIRRGRAFDDKDRAAGRPAFPAVVSESTAARAWPGQDPIGKRFRRGDSDAKPFEVVGVVADGRAIAVDVGAPMMVYVPYWFRSRATAALIVRTKADPVALIPSIRRAIEAVDPEIAVGASRPLAQVVGASFAARRYQATLLVAFGAVALLITIVGVYAVTAYGVSRRRREMNIRVALGARPSQVVGLVIRQTSVPVAAGIAAGAIGSLAAGGAVAGLLFGVRARNPVILFAVIAAVGTAAACACLAAARRGLVVDPASALRED